MSAPIIKATLVIETFDRGRRVYAVWKIICPFCRCIHYHSAGAVMSMSTIIKYNVGLQTAWCSDNQYIIDFDLEQVKACLTAYKKGKLRGG